MNSFPMKQFYPSLSLEIVIFLDSLYTIVFGIIEIADTFSVGTELTLSKNFLLLQLFTVLLFMLLQNVRFYVGSTGNRTGNTLILIAFWVLCTFVLVIYILFLSVRPYITSVGTVIYGIGLAFVAYEFLDSFINFSML